jgi:glycosyltransferase involved in cell wall biosynthesis
LKILHVIANLAPRYGGPPKACLEMARASARLGNEVHIYTTNQDGNSELTVPTDRVVQQDGVSIRYFPIQRPKFWGTSLPLARALKEKIPDVDIVHIHSLYLFHTAVSALYCEKFQTPYVIRPHGTLGPYIYKRHRFRKLIVENLFQNRVFRYASGIHFITDEEKMLGEKYTFGAPGFVVPIGLDAEVYEKKVAKEKLFSRFPELTGKKIILFMGRVNFIKGMDILVGAFSAVSRERDDVHLLIAGSDDSDYGKKVSAWLKKEDVYKKTTFAGMLQGEEKLEAFYYSSVFVLPSYSENFGIAVLEAMACGLPVVVSEKVNLGPTVVAAKAGLVAPCNAEMFSRKILNILNDDNLARQMGMNGIALVRNKFSWQEIACKLLSVYSSLITKSNH